jgi:hypothetical protein
MVRRSNLGVLHFQTETKRIQTRTEQNFCLDNLGSLFRNYARLFARRVQYPTWRRVRPIW